MNGTESIPKAKYQRPPIQEAVCEIRFSMPSPLIKEEIERIQSTWTPEYPIQQMVAEQSVELHLAVDRVDTKSTSVGNKLITRSSDGKNLAQLGSNFLAVNRLNPYVGWEESFRDTILARINEVQRVYTLKEMERVGLRYINKIDFPESNLCWTDWFVMALPVPGGLGERGGSFQFHFERQLDSNVRAVINFLSLPSPPDSGTSVILDIDVFCYAKQNISAIRAVLEEIHEPHHMLFEGYLLDKTRELFQIKS
jgi:uncharacterized protein (TIGR04255 family)